MDRALAAAALAAAAIVCLPTASMAETKPAEVDRAQLSGLVYAFEQAWNRHDMVAFANLFWDDAEWVHWRGGLWTGRPEIYEGHRAIHESYYKTSQAKVQGIEALHLLAPTVAYVRVRSDMTGDQRSPNEVFRYRRTMLFEKRGNEWRIAKGHNTRIVGNTGVDWKPSNGSETATPSPKGGN